MGGRVKAGRTCTVAHKPAAHKSRVSMAPARHPSPLCALLCARGCICQDIGCMGCGQGWPSWALSILVPVSSDLRPSSLAPSPPVQQPTRALCAVRVPAQVWVGDCPGQRHPRDGVPQCAVPKRRGVHLPQARWPHHCSVLRSGPGKSGGMGQGSAKGAHDWLRCWAWPRPLPARMQSSGLFLHTPPPPSPHTRLLCA